MKVVLYNCMLDTFQSQEEWERVELEYRLGCHQEILSLSRSLQGLGVSLLACQKVVNTRLARQLEREGVTVLERLGTKGFHRLFRLCGGRAIASPVYRYFIITTRYY